MRRFPHLVTLLFALASVGLLPSAAAAAPPANDARAAAQDVPSLPALVRGTTVEATLEEDEPFPTCGATKGSVWYAFTAARSREVLLALDAAGDMDATVELFERARSQVTSLTCSRTNRRGEATLDVDATAGTAYLVRVAPLANSVEDTFSLRIVLPDAPASPPGDPLPAGGTSGQVDRFANPDDAWAVRMEQGRTYRVNLVSKGSGCVNVELFAPGEFGGAASRRLHCDDHTVFTPPASGRYTLLVRARRPRRARGSRTACAPGWPSATTARPASCCPTTSGSAARCTGTSSTRSTSTGSRSPGAATCGSGCARATTSTCSS